MKVNYLFFGPIIVRRRHVQSIGRSLNFGSLNVRSLSPSKLDAVLMELRDRLLDVTLLCETWHDADSVSIRRLRSEGYTVVERACPLRVDASLDVNHGGDSANSCPSRTKPVDIRMRRSSGYIWAIVLPGPRRLSPRLISCDRPVLL